MPTTTGTKSSNADAYLYVGATGGSWGSASNWSDTTTGTNPAPFVPGTLTPVTIASRAGSTLEVNSDGGSAASVDLTGDVGLSGGCTVGGAFGVSGSLALAAGGTVSAGSVNVSNGTLSLAGGASVFSAGPVAVGPAGGFFLGPDDVPYPSAASGTVNLAAGAALSAAGDVSVNSGTLNDAGGTAAIGGALTVGWSGTLTSPAASTSTASVQDGEVCVTAGGTSTVGGAVTVEDGIIVVSGAGSKLTTGGTLTAKSGKAYLLSRYDQINDTVVAWDGGLIQFGGAVFNAASAATATRGYFYAPGLCVDAASTIEIGNAGGASAGAITVDAGKAITANANASLIGALVNNGTVAVADGTLSQGGNLSGSGTVQIGKGATFALYGTAAATDTIAFLDAGATLSIGSHSDLNGATTPYSIDAILTGLQAGDSIVLGTPVSTIAYAAGSGSSPGTLTLRNGATTVETLRLAGNFAGKIFSTNPMTNGGASINVTDGPVGSPVVSSPTLSVAENAVATALGVAAPTDPNYAAGQLTVTATGLPTNGIVSLADGTAVVAGQALTSDQFVGLRFKPTPGLFNASSTFAYTVSDPANNTVTGTATLAIGPAVGNPVLSSPTLTVAENASATALGIAAPYDPNYPTEQLAIAATGLPGDGTLTLADGTAVAAGQALTSAQLTGLQFKPTPGLFNIGSAFVYTVSDPAGNASTASATLAIGPAVGSPVLSPTTLAVAENAVATAMGIAAPTDPNYNIGQLAITATGLPSDGAVTLADGTAVVAGQMLTSAQLAGLRFKPTPGLFNASSAFTYTVGDPANNAAVGTATLAIGPAVGNPVLSSPTLAVAGNAASTALGIAAPTDPNYGAGQLAIAATGLPNDGTVTLADGVTAVIAGQALTSAQLAGLRFTPTPGLFNAKSTFAYTASDPAGNASAAAATLAIGLPPTPKAEFDAAYYLQNNPDVAKAKVDPFEHFEASGWKEGRNPDALFNVRYYLNQNPDVAAAKVDPLAHYETSGWKEGRDPSVNFSTAAYLKANPDVAKAHIDPLKHYIEHGSSEGRMLFAAQPHGVGAQDPLVDNAYYFSKYSDVGVSGANPFTHYDTVGWRQGRNPDALFDTNYYLQHNPDVRAAAVDPLLHYERTGWKEGRDPSAQFSTSKYLAANADVKAAGVNPLVHYEQHGMQEGRAIFHV